MMRRILAVILVLFSSLFLVSCKNEEVNGSVKPTAVSIKSVDNLRAVMVGKTLQLEAVVYPEDAPQTVTWESNDPEIATVNQEGTVSGVKEGRVKISATASSVSGHIYITVFEEYVSATSIRLEVGVEIYVDEYHKLEFELEPENAEPKIIWSSDNEEIARVDNNGRVFGKQPGTVNITASSGSVTDTVSLKVLPRSGNPESIVLKMREILEVGEEVRLRVLTEPRGALNDATYASSDESVATVDEEGIVRTVGAGNATITAVSQHGGAQASLEIEVRNYEIDLDNWSEAFKQVIAATKNSVFGVANYQYVSDQAGNKHLTKKSIGSGVIYKVLFELQDGSMIHDRDDLEGFGDVKLYHYYLVTNKHVIVGSDAVKIYLHDIDEEVPAELIQYDEKVDIAVIHFAHDRYLRPLRFADVSDLQSGEHVIALGNPSGFEYSSSATHGIVSHPKRYIPDDTDGDGINDWEPEYIQHDAAINPGNSGGPLLNLRGEIIGINTLKFASTEIDNMGFSIPSHIVVGLLEYLEKGEVPTRAVLGVTSITVRDLLDRPDPQYPVPDWVTYGIYVIEVVPGSKAAQGGLRPGDIILSANSRELKKTLDLRSELDKMIAGSGSKLKFEVLREGKIIEIEIIF
jgi:S1-C subfamily serine protease